MADSPLAHGPTLAASRPDASGPGERLASGTACGEYVVEAFLGAGAMGEVYAGNHPVIGKRVAIKVLRRDAASSEAAERLVREARAASQIDHPNVIDVFALGRTADGRLYLVMDLVDGRSLREELRGGPLAPERALAILDQIADALDAAHARGVIHRDLKPDNIMLAGERRAHVLDFGLAKLVSSAHGDVAPGTLTGQGTWLGTPGYMAPEQWSADGAGPASDRYALGVIAFELLAGRLPFEAASVPAMMEQHFRAPVPSISRRGAVTLPAAVDAVLQRALAKDPDARYASARELVDALRAALGGTARAAPRRGKLVPAVTGAGVLGLGVVVALVARHGGDAAATHDVPAPPAGGVETIVTSQPDRAEVRVDDRLAGTTPLHVPLKAGASAALVVRKPGYLEARRTIVGAAGSREHVELTPVTRFEGVWRQPSGELRAFARQADEVDVFKLDAVSGPRRFYRHYSFALADHGVAFGADEEAVDPRAPDDPSCHVAVHVEYRYDPDRDVLELRRDKLSLDLVGGHCVVRAREIEQLPMVRVDDAHDVDVIHAPAGPPSPVKRGKPRPQPKQKQVVRPAPAQMQNQQAPNPPPNLDQAAQQAPEPSQQLTPQQAPRVKK